MVSTRSALPLVVLLAPLGLVAAGCSSAPPPDPKPAPTPTQPPPPPPPAIDLSPVAEPAGLVATVRGKSLSSLVDGWVSCTKMASSDVQKGVDLAIHELAKDMFGRARREKVAAVFAQGQPIDFVGVADVKNRKDPTRWVFSFGVTALDAAKAAFEETGELSEKSPGVWVIPSGERRGPHCALFASAGPTPGRVVCSDEQRDVLDFGPYMARTLPLKQLGGGDLHGEFDLKGIETHAGKELRDLLDLHPSVASEVKSGEAALDKAVAVSVKAVAGELGALLGDLDKLSLDASLDPTACGSGGVSLSLRDTKSWTAQVLAERPERARAAPPMFWRLPKDAATGSWAVGGDPALQAPVVKGLKELIDGALGFAKVGSAADRKAVTDLLDVNLGKDVVTVGGYGGAGAGAAGFATFLTMRQDGAAPRDQKAMQKEVDDLVRQFLPWMVSGVDKKSDPIVKWTKDLAGAWNRKPFQDALKNLLAKGRGELKVPTLKVVPAPAQLGKGATALEVKITWEAPEPSSIAPAPPPPAPGKKAAPPKPAAKAKPITLTATVWLMVMPDGEETWVGFGTDKDEIVKHLLVAKSGGDASKTLASRAELAPLKTKKALYAGFYTAETYVSLAKTAAAEMKKHGQASDAKMIEDAIARLPHKGATPGFLHTEFDPATKRYSLKLDVQRGTFEDIGALVNHMITILRKP